MVESYTKLFYSHHLIMLKMSVVSIFFIVLRGNKSFEHAVVITTIIGYQNYIVRLSSPLTSIYVDCSSLFLEISEVTIISIILP